MCGIAGLWTNQSGFALDAVARTMADAIMHRGPDSSGIFTQNQAGVALAHRRLSIIDLSPSGHQPMPSPSGRYQIVYNGEIYNFAALRTEIVQREPNIIWRGHSDTEVLIAAIEIFGVVPTLQKLNGMFALALWDESERCLWLARDRVGEKPLYYSQVGGHLFFGSELKALKQHPAFDRTLDHDALAAYMRHAYVPAPHTAYAHVRKLLPGSFLRLNSPIDDAAPQAYWTWPLLQPASARAELNSLMEQFESLLTESVRLRMFSDVPMGAFLSGGIDSSTITALMQIIASQPVKTYSIGFDEADFDESGYARQVAQHLGTDHLDLRVTAADALSVVPQLPQLFDEPFADSSQIPTYLLCKLTRNHVTVALSGDAGDELFGGYTRYFWGQTVQNILSKWPHSARAPVGHLLSKIPSRQLDSLVKFAPERLRRSFTPSRLYKSARLLNVRRPEEAYRLLVSSWPNPRDIMLKGTEPPSLLENSAFMDSMPNFVLWMMAMDQRTYLPDDILVKVDRAAMAVSLETRIPFLDPNLITWAAQLPLEANVREKTGKLMVRRLLEKFVPKHLFERPKQGFGIPLDAWLRGPLKSWGEDLLFGKSIETHSVLNSGVIRNYWTRHQTGLENLQSPLWTALMLEAWLTENA
jgi:asparagine synthase (glutamine-hydrolysing)